MGPGIDHTKVDVDSKITGEGTDRKFPIPLSPGDIEWEKLTGDERRLTPRRTNMAWHKVTGDDRAVAVHNNYTSSGMVPDTGAPSTPIKIGERCVHTPRQGRTNVLTGKVTDPGREPSLSRARSASPTLAGKITDPARSARGWVGPSMSTLDKQRFLSGDRAFANQRTYTPRVDR